MRREYDVFERFADGSTLWRATVVGRFEALRKMQELAELSDNEFMTLDIQAAKPLQAKLVLQSPKPIVKPAAAA